MKLVAMILAVLAAVAMAAYPPQFGQAQTTKDTQPIVKLAEPIDTQGVSPTTKALIDSFNAGYLRISAKTDTIVALARELENKAIPQKYEITEYKPPISVMQLKFENKTILAQWDSAKGVFIEKEVVIK